MGNGALLQQQKERIDELKEALGRAKEEVATLRRAEKQAQTDMVKLAHQVRAKATESSDRQRQIDDAHGVAESYKRENVKLMVRQKQKLCHTCCCPRSQ